MKKLVPLVLIGLCIAAPALAQERVEKKESVEVRVERMDDGTARRVVIRHRDGMPPDTTVTIVEAGDLDRIHVDGDDDVIVIERGDRKVEILRDGEGRTFNRRWRQAPRDGYRPMRPFDEDVRVFRMDGDELHFEGAEGLRKEYAELFEGAEDLHREGVHLRRMGENLFYSAPALHFDGTMSGRLGGMMNAEIREMERRSRDLARQIRAADDADRPALEAELDALLAEIFDAKQALRAEHMAEMEKRLAELRDEQRQRTQQRREIIERRKRELLGEGDPLRW